ncbi:hypothetical protein ZIOFF_001184 [Zingiber officinale]|uniref:Uncharacterized protein n=1 Tax=Zingiber officinale TaxID=94328 RepID=A0A8J5I9F0_ZINOF|nr:hypothetical protein ZIOFF_001184 [Zingiber officinale]
MRDNCSSSFVFHAIENCIDWKLVTLAFWRIEDGGQPFSLKDINVAAVHCVILNPIHDVLDIDGGISSFKKLPKKGKKVIERTNGRVSFQRKTMKRREVRAGALSKYHSGANSLFIA